MDVIWQPSTEIVRLSRLCMITKSAIDSVNEVESNPENTEAQKSEIHFPALFTLLLENDITNFSNCTSKVLPNLIILYFQRSKVNNWNSPRIFEQAQKLNSIFKDKYKVNIYDLFKKSDENMFNAQEVFDNTMMELSRRVQSRDQIRKYPGIVAVYYLILEWIQMYDLYLNPMIVCPISVSLIDDYDIINTSNGLKCLWVMMQMMTEKDFDEGNYYEVIFESLKRALHQKDIELTAETLAGLLKFLNHIVPHDAKSTKRDEILGVVLEMVHMETNLRRKKEFFVFLKKLVDAHKVNCVSRKLLKTVLCENVHVCCNDAVADILLADVLECLQSWVKYCWCTWKLSTDHELISALIKLLYVNRKEKTAANIQDLLITFISLCSKNERVLIKNNLEKCQITALEFREKLDEIKLEIDQ